MTGLTFSAWRNTQAIGLAEVLLVIGKYALPLRWRLALDDVSPSYESKALESIPPERDLNIFELVHLTTPKNVQIVDGKIMAYTSDGTLVLIITAIRNDDWDVETTDIRILNAIKEFYTDAIPLP